MKTMKHLKTPVTLLALLIALSTASCGTPQTGGNADSTSPEGASGESESAQSGRGQSGLLGKDDSASEFVQKYDSFAQAHDAFTTTLAREENDDYTHSPPPPISSQ